MAKIFLFIFVVLYANTNIYSQCACCAGASIGSSSGNFNSGIITLQKKQFIVEAYTDYRTIKLKAPQNHDNVLSAEGQSQVLLPPETPLKSIMISTIGLRYGLSDKVTISALLPFAFLHTNIGNDNGLGDLNLLATLNAYRKKDFNLALQAGVELPTGIQKGSNFDNTTVVVGSGSVDPILGMVLLKNWNKISLQGNALYKYTTKGFKGNYYSSVSSQNLSLSYQVKGGNNFCSPDSANQNPKSKLSWTVFGGYYGEWLGMVKEENIADENSGYYLGFATLGTNLSIKKWSFPLTISYPFIQKMNGEQNDAGPRVRLGVIKSL